MDRSSSVATPALPGAGGSGGGGGGKRSNRRPSEGETNNAKGTELSESELEKQRALLLAQLKEPESE